MSQLWPRRWWSASANSSTEATPQAEGQNTYCRKAPDPQNALDIFAGEWTSQLPAPLDDLQAGQALLFEDARLAWAVERLGGVAGRRILELGPLEAGHTYLLDRAGAADVLAIEANTRAYLKCLVIKELLAIRASRFVCGDFITFLRETQDRFDLVIASGVLYHMVNPVEVIARLAAVTDAVYFWTHYYDETLFRSRPATAQRIVQPEPAEHGGYRHLLHRNDYRTAPSQAGFCGGNSPYSYWLTRDDILGALRHFGFGNVEVAYEQTDYLHGPALSILARR